MSSTPTSIGRAAPSVVGSPAAPPAPAAPRGELIGVVAMLACVLCFSLMDAAMKGLASHYPPLQVAALRGLVSLPLVLAWVAVRSAWRELWPVRLGLQCLRGVFSILILFAFVYAVKRLSLADAYAIFFLAPLLIGALSGPVLGERVDGHRWAALVVGLVGVLVVLRPSARSLLDPGGLAVLAAALGYAFGAITVRVLSRTDSAMSMVFWLILVVAVGAGVAAWPTWKPVSAAHWPLLACLAVTGTLGQVALTYAFSRARPSVVAPFEYTALLCGVALDWVVWSTRPGLRTLVGAAIVIASGLYVLRRETQAS